MDTSIEYIDTCGLSCPQPVLLLHKAIQAQKNSIDIVVDNEASRENVSRAALKHGYQILTETRKAPNSGEYTLELRK